MGNYSETKLVALERVLIQQHDAKVIAKAKRKPLTKDLLTARRIGELLNLPEEYVRRYAWERRLRPFPEAVNKNDIRLAEHLVVHLGFSVKQAAAITGFKAMSIDNHLDKRGFKKFVCWGNTKSKRLAIPKQLQGWRVNRWGKLFESEYQMADVLGSHYGGNKAVA